MKSVDSMVGGLSRVMGELIPEIDALLNFYMSLSNEVSNQK